MSKVRPWASVVSLILASVSAVIVVAFAIGLLVEPASTFQSPLLGLAISMPPFLAIAALVLCAGLRRVQEKKVLTRVGTSLSVTVLIAWVLLWAWVSTHSR